MYTFTKAIEFLEACVYGDKFLTNEARQQAIKAFAYLRGIVPAECHKNCRHRKGYDTGACDPIERRKTDGI